MKTLTIQISTILFALILGLFLHGCTSNEASSENNPAHEDHSEHNHQAEEAEAGHSHQAEASGEELNSEALHQVKAGLQENEVLITQKQMKRAGIELGEITHQQLSKVVKSFGEIALAPSDEATVSALIGGIIRDIQIMEGDFVRRG